MPQYEKITEKETQEVTDNIEFVSVSSGKVGKTPWSNMLDAIKAKIAAWTFNLTTSNKTLPGALNELNTKINKQPSHTMISMEISTLVIGSCPSATEHVITAELPTGYSSANSYVLGVRIERGDGAVVYMDDGKTGTTYLDNVNKINFAPTSFGITYCAGNRVSAIVCKVS